MTVPSGQTEELDGGQIADLQRLAEAATPGPWSVEVNGAGPVNGPGEPIDVWTEVCVSFDGANSWLPDGQEFAMTPGLMMGDHEGHEADAEFIAAANPAVVLALIAEVGRLAGEVETLKRDRRADDRAWLEQDSRLRSEWAVEYDRAHRATYSAQQWEQAAERLAGMGRAVQTQRDEERIRAEHAESTVAALRETIGKVRALADHARLVSPSDRMTVMIGDLDHALGDTDQRARRRTGSNDGTTP